VGIERIVNRGLLPCAARLPSGSRRQRLPVRLLKPPVQPPPPTAAKQPFPPLPPNPQGGAARGAGKLPAHCGRFLAAIWLMASRFYLRLMLIFGQFGTIFVVLFIVH